MAPSGLAFVAGALLAPFLVQRLQPSALMAIGFVVAAIGFAIVGQAAATGNLGFLVAGYCVFSLGLAPIFTLTTDLIVDAVPPGKTGAAAGLSEASTELGGALGIAILGSLMTIAYASSLGGAPGAASLASIVSEGAGARGPGLDAARGALGQSLQIAAFVCVATALAGAGLTRFIGTVPPVVGDEASR